MKHAVRTSRPVSLMLTLGASLLTLLTLAACGGGGGGGSDDPTPPTPPTLEAPSNLAYAGSPGLFRAAEAVADMTPTSAGGTPTLYEVSPALPAGLSLDPTTGVISGTPTTPAAGSPFVVTASNTAGSTTANVTLAIGAALPSTFVSLRDEFQAEQMLTNPQVTKSAKMALLPDGRILYIEVDAGTIRIVDAGGTLLGTPYIDLSAFMLGGQNVTLLIGSHRGLFGLAAAPDFSSTGFVYVMLSVEEAGNTNQRSVILRFTDDPNNNVATNMQVVLDNLPVATINNGGELLFDGNGPEMFVSIGDVTNSANAQAAPATSLAGKILRINPTTPATVPAGNASGTFEFARGLRNCYGMAQHPTTTNLYAADNEGMEMSTGFEMLDELNLVLEGKNAEWGAPDSGMGSVPPADRAFAIWESTNLTVTPTSLAWHTGADFSTATTDSLLMSTYNDHKIRQFVIDPNPMALSLDSVTDFAELTVAAQGNFPMDLVVDDTTDAIYLVLLSGIYRITKIQ